MNHFRNSYLLRTYSLQMKNLLLAQFSNETIYVGFFFTQNESFENFKNFDVV